MKRIWCFSERTLVEEDAPLIEDSPSKDEILVEEDAPLIEDAPSQKKIEEEKKIFLRKCPRFWMYTKESNLRMKNLKIKFIKILRD